jgi:hypothetical protein
MFRRRFLQWAALGAAGTVGTAARPLWADVDVVTLPRREGTQLTIYNSEDITMVREHRLLTLKKGVNRIQFSWANTLIDPTSIDFRILDPQDKVSLLDTTYPNGRNDALQWNIDSEIAGQAAVEIRYFTSGITWTADYVGVANQEETRLQLTGYVRVFNNSGELYDNAETRMVVGNINLVEKIAALAQLPAPTTYAAMPDDAREMVRDEVSKAVRMAMPADMDAAGPGGFGGGKPDGPPQVVKQGLSEYFLFSIEGREDIKDGEPKRLVSLKVAEAPLETIYKLTDREGGAQFAKFYRFKNEKLRGDQGAELDLPAMENLGTSPLPNGAVRLFSEYANKDLAYVGGTTAAYVPIGDRLEVNVGADPDITIVRRLKDQQTTGILARQYKRREDDTFVVLFDLIDFNETFTFEEEIVSGKSKPVKLELERRFEDNIVLWGEGEAPADWDSDEPGAYVDLHALESKVERVDANHVKYYIDLQPGEKRLVTYKVTYKRRKVGPELNLERKREPL